MHATWIACGECGAVRSAADRYSYGVCPECGSDEAHEYAMLQDAADASLEMWKRKRVDDLEAMMDAAATVADLYAGEEMDDFEREAYAERDRIEAAAEHYEPWMSDYGDTEVAE